MTEYDIEIEIDTDDNTITASTPSGVYTYDLDSVKGADLLSKLLGSNVHATIYSQGREQ